MRIIDGHCDVLSKMLEHPQVHFEDDERLDVTLTRLEQGGIAMQCFAVYLSESLGVPKFSHILQCVDLLHERILSHDRMTFVRTSADLANLAASGNNRIGAMLTLEGADGLEGDLMHLRILFQLGLRMIGLTWNYANWAADGVMEPRKGGLTLKGEKLVKECNRLGIIIDISHLAEKGFWDVAEKSTKPFVATHSNCSAVCPHPRNLNDDQIKHLIAAGGIMGVTFVPWFVKSAPAVTVQDLLPHIDHICALGGQDHIAFGSDFDGIDKWVDGLEHPGQYVQLAETLSKYYNDELAESFLYGNWYKYLVKNLPGEG